MTTNKKCLVTLYKSVNIKQKTDLVIDMLFMLESYKVVENDVLNDDDDKKVYLYLIELLDNNDVNTLLEKHLIQVNS